MLDQSQERPPAYYLYNKPLQTMSKQKMADEVMHEIIATARS